jgi:hypothetical protein
MANFTETIRNSSGNTVWARDNIFVTHSGKNFYEYGGTWTSGGYNIFSDDSWPGDLAAGDLENTDPKLGSIGNYGGLTLTHSLREGSPAINHRPGICKTILLPFFEDQRHFPRNDGNCDTGAFEQSGSFFEPVYLPLINR